MELTEDLKKILNIGIALTSEKSYTKLLEEILKQAMNITNSDAGTLYLYEPDGLQFIILANNTLNTYQGGDGEKVNLPKVPLKEENVCAYCAIHQKVINIEDVHNSTLFDFSGPRQYDSITNYYTKSMLVVPLISHENDIIGVIQLINAMDENGVIIPYEKSMEYITYCLASQASVSLANMLYIEQIKKQMYSFVSVLTTAIDEMSAYTANHTYSVAQHLNSFAEYINTCHGKGKTDYYFDEHRCEEMSMAAMLHDVGKITVPPEIMDKPTRLGNKKELLFCRLDLIKALLRVDVKAGIISPLEFTERDNEIDHLKELIEKNNHAPYLKDEIYKELEIYAGRSYNTPNFTGNEIPYLTYEEKEDLFIQKGTLNKEERVIMEGHVIVTDKILEKIYFSKEYSNVREWASSHHEFLDGSGYPKHLKGEEIAIETRMLTIADIYDALVSQDRPYKKAKTKEEALHILHAMAEDGKLDKTLTKLFDNYINRI